MTHASEAASHQDQEPRNTSTEDHVQQIEFLKNQLSRRTKIMSEQRAEYYRQLVALKEMLFQKARLGPGYEPDLLPEYSPTFDGDPDNLKKQFNEALAKALESKAKEYEKAALDRERDLQHQLNKYIDHCTKLSDNIKKKDGQITSLTARTKDLEVVIKEEKDRASKHDELVEELSKLKEENADVIEENSEMKSKIQGLTEENAELKQKMVDFENNKIKNLEEQLVITTEENEEISGKLAVALEEKSTVSLENQQLSEEVKRLSDRLTSLESDYSTLESESKKFQSQVDDLNQQVVILTDQRDHLESKAQNSDAQGQSQIKQMQELLEKKQQEEEDLKTKLETAIDKAREEEQDKFKDELSKLETQLAVVQAKYDQMETERDDLFKKVEKQSEMIEKLQTQSLAIAENYDEVDYHTLQQREQNLVNATSAMIDSTSELKETDEELRRHEEEALRLKEESRRAREEYERQSRLQQESLSRPSTRLESRPVSGLEDRPSSRNLSDYGDQSRPSSRHKDISLPSPHPMQPKEFLTKEFTSSVLPSSTPVPKEQIKNLEVFDRLEARARDMLSKISRRRLALERERRRHLESVLSAVRLLLNPMDTITAPLTKPLTPRPHAYHSTNQSEFSVAITPQSLNHTGRAQTRGFISPPQVNSLTLKPNYCRSCREFCHGEHVCDSPTTLDAMYTPRSHRFTQRSPRSVRRPSSAGMPEQSLVNMSMDTPHMDIPASPRSKVKVKSLPLSLSSPNRAERRQAIINLLSGKPSESVTNSYRISGTGVSPRKG
ncbi:hypothetical protein GEMRC1_008509 [Eukaryota sp. GEM-RC1]